MCYYLNVHALELLQIQVLMNSGLLSHYDVEQEASAQRCTIINNVSRFKTLQMSYKDRRNESHFYVKAMQYAPYRGVYLEYQQHFDGKLSQHQPVTVAHGVSITI
jgi:hypothetical protein